MIKTVSDYIEKNKLLTESKPVVVGLSGGADSVALLIILVRLGYKCIALHCNFHLRGEESDRDENFSRCLAEKLNVPFYSIDFDTVGHAETKHLSIEMAARELRYAWFEEKREELNAQAIAVAHHRDDNVETLLMNLIRGTGIRGMVGIRPKNDYVIRPLLTISRDSILIWLKMEQQDYIIDSTNLVDAYTRNFIRLRILPLLEDINPSVKQSLARTTEYMADVESIYLQFIEEARQKVVTADNRVSISELLALPASKTILFELLKPYGFNPIVSGEIYQSLIGEAGKTFYSVSHRLIKDRDYLLITPACENNQTSTYKIESPEDFKNLPNELSACQFVLKENLTIEKDKRIAYFDLDKVRFPLTLRRWKEGDWFIPFGMKGKKKLSDYFSDHKYSLIQKEKAWLLCSGEDIIWLVGERTDNRFRIENSTKEVLIIKKMR